MIKYNHNWHYSAIIENAVIGDNTRIGPWCHLMHHSIVGSNCILHHNTLVYPDAKIGDSCKIQANVCLFGGVTLENEVFIGPNVAFTNVKFPRAFIENKKYSKTLVKQGATIGANATIVCGVTIGKYALVGAGAVVTRDVPDYGLVAGNPAQLIDRVTIGGSRLYLRKEEL